jgi:hypothetical protein
MWGIAEGDPYFIDRVNLISKSFFYLVMRLMIVDVCAKTKKKYVFP